MPYEIDTTILNAAMIDAFEADKPIFVAVNQIAEQGSWTPDAQAEWRESGSWASGSDITAPGYETSAVFDGYGDVITKPIYGDGGLDPETSDEVSLLFKFPHPGIDFNALALIGHNFADFGTGTEDEEYAADRGLFVYVDISNNGAAWTSIRTGHPASGDNTRLVWIQDDTTYLKVRYMRIRFRWFSDDTGPLPMAPEVGEFFVGERIQLSKQPNRAFDPFAVTHDTSVAIAKSGAVSKYVRYSGKASISATWEPKINGEADTLDDYASLRSWHRQASNGTGFFLFVPRPTSLLTSCYLMHSPDALFTRPENEPFLASCTIAMEEQPPFVYEEEAAEIIAPPLFALSLPDVDSSVTYVFDELSLATEFILSFDLYATDLGGGNTTGLALFRNGYFGDGRVLDVSTASYFGGTSLFVRLGLPAGSPPEYYVSGDITIETAVGYLENETWANVVIDFDGSRTGNDRLRIIIDEVDVSAGCTYSATPPAFIGSINPVHDDCHLVLGAATHTTGDEPGFLLDNFSIQAAGVDFVINFDGETLDPEAGSVPAPDGVEDGEVTFEERI